MVGASTRGKSRASFADVCTLESLFRHKWLAMLVFTIGLLTTAGVLYLRDRSYDSLARIFVRLGRESVTVDPTASATGQVVKLSDSQQREIQSVMDIMKSDYLLEYVVDKLGEEQILNYSEPQAEEVEMHPLLEQAKVKWGDFREFLADIRLADPVNRRAKALKTLGKRIKITSEEQSNVISIRARAESPKLSQMIGNAILEGFQDRHIEAHRSAGAYGFFAEQSEITKKELDAKETELRDAKNYASFTSIEDQREVLTERLKDVELGLLQSLSEFEGTSAKTQDMSDSLKNLPERIESQTVIGLTNTSKDEMRGTLYSLQLEEADLLSKLSEDHPTVVKKREQMKKAGAVFDIERVPPQITTAINSVHQEIKVAYLQGRADSVGSTARIRELKDQREQVLTEICDLNRKAIVIGDLERQIDVLDSKYRRYVDSLEQARIDEALQKDRLSSINLIQPPTFNDDPMDLSNSIIALGGFVTSLLAAFGAAFGMRFLRNRLTSVADVERELNLPVLAAIPFSRQKRLKFS